MAESKLAETDLEAAEHPADGILAVEGALVITCEHGGNRIPEPYRDHFYPYKALLQTHRGFDVGALTMARTLARAFGAPMVVATVSRLLVDLNRSVGHPHLHCPAVRVLPAPIRAAIIDQYYRPYRIQVERIVMRTITERGRVLHLSSHSFTPELDGKTREADIGLLYDPARPGEVALAARWRAAIQACAPGLTVRRNYPYAGRNDGLTTSLRKHLSADVYTAIELEINQKHILAGGRQWTALRKTVVQSLRTALYPSCPDSPRAAPDMAKTGPQILCALCSGTPGPLRE